MYNLSMSLNLFHPCSDAAKYVVYWCLHWKVMSRLCAHLNHGDILVQCWVITGILLFSEVKVEICIKFGGLLYVLFPPDTLVFLKRQVNLPCCCCCSSLLSLLWVWFPFNIAFMLLMWNMVASEVLCWYVVIEMKVVIVLLPWIFI